MYAYRRHWLSCSRSSPSRRSPCSPSVTSSASTGAAPVRRPATSASRRASSAASSDRATRAACRVPPHRLAGAYNPSPARRPPGGTDARRRPPLPDPSRLLARARPRARRSIGLYDAPDPEAFAPLVAADGGRRPRAVPVPLLPPLGEGRDAAPHGRQLRLRRLRPLAVRRADARARGLHRLPLGRRGPARHPRAHGRLGRQRADLPPRARATSWSGRSSRSSRSTSRR